MIHFVFTLDYEIYGDGTGSLRELVYEPAERLKDLFLAHGVRFVNFVEAAEFERIEEAGSDPAIGDVKRQIRELHHEGFETGLHLHPQWYNGVYQLERWTLDESEYNLCRLPRHRIEQIVDRALNYLRHLVDDSSFTPLSFRAGNWLFQPTRRAAGVLADRGVRVDSSVFKGGLQHRHGLDYRAVPRHANHWRFEADVTIPDDGGRLVELPIHTEMVAAWRMATKKRVAFARRGGLGGQSRASRMARVRDVLRLRYPLKLDFCRMTLDELIAMTERIVREDLADGSSARPVVAIGHTKDLVDLDTVDAFLRYLESRRVRVTTLRGALTCLNDASESRPDRRLPMPHVPSTDGHRPPRSL